MNKTDSIIDRCERETLNGKPSFRNVTVEDIPMLRRWFGMYPSRSCDFTVGGVLIWTAFYNYKIAEFCDSLLITGFDPDSGKQIFYQPPGPISPDRYKKIADEYCRETGTEYVMLYPEERHVESTAEIPEEEPGYIRNMMEYLYEVERFASFGGKKMEKKRCHLHYFLNNFTPYEVEEINESNIDDLITFTLAFELSHSDSQLAQYEATQIVDLLRVYGKYPFIGIALRKDGRIIGYSFGECVGDTFSVHAEKGDIYYRGIYQALSSLMAQKVMQDYPQVKYLNREDDMGMESLRQSKLSYHPSLVIAKKIL